MKKTITAIIILLLMVSCAGPLWDGEERSLEEEKTITVTIIFDDPILELYSK